VLSLRRRVNRDKPVTFTAELADPEYLDLVDFVRDELELEAHKRPTPPIVVRGAPAFAGASDTDYVCGRCHAVICAGVRNGAFVGFVFQCSCGQFNRGPSLG
jgi:hypothetical protein